MISATPQFDSDGLFTGYVGVGWDLTPLRSLERQAVERAAHLDSILENIGEGVGLVDADLKFVAFNRRLVECLGLILDQVKPGDSFEELLRILARNGEYAPQDSDDAIAERLTLARTGKPMRRERTRPDGRIYEVRINPLAAGGFVMAHADITDIKAQQAQLVQAQKMEAVGQLTGGVAHDFNNILMIILTGLEALEEEGLEPHVRERLGRIARAAERAADLIRQLLAFSRRQVLLPQYTNLNTLVATTSELMRRTLGQHIVIETDLADQPWIIKVDRAQLEAALINLCVNARDAMSRGGRLRIATRNVSVDGSYASPNDEAEPGQYVLLSVSDNGTGIAPEHLRRVFEPFFTTKEIGKGTGLGLSMVYGFIKQSGGHIEIESGVGKGTTFKIYLPRSHGGEVEEAGRVSSSPRGSERVLVVEDDPSVRAAVVEQLIGLGYDVSSAAGGTEALAQLAKGPAYDLLLTDIVKPPPMNGRDLADAARELYPGLRIVFMSGFADIGAKASALELSVRLIAKPFRRAEVARTIRAALDER
jgi:PAS domain S-box-containing protein